MLKEPLNKPHISFIVKHESFDLAINTQKVDI